MSDLWLFLILVAVALAFVSTLVYINLRAQGVATPRVVRLLGELWGGFALIVAILAYISRVLGTTPAGSPGQELLVRLTRWHELTTGQQVMVIGGTLLALFLFIHMMYALHAVQRHATRRVSPYNGGNTQ